MENQCAEDHGPNGNGAGAGAESRQGKGNRSIPVGRTDKLGMLNIVIPNGGRNHGQSDGHQRSTFHLTVRDKCSNIQPQKPLIERVPPILRRNKDNDKYYDPIMVSIGPYHHGQPELELVEKLKDEIMLKFFSDTGKSTEYCFNAVAEIAEDARGCYVEGSTDAYDKEAFARMMFLDGTLILFLIDSFIHYRPEHLELIVNHLSNLAWLPLFMDLFLLENQIPFKVLQVLMSLKYKEDEGEEMINNFFNYVNSVESESESKINQKLPGGVDGKKPLHLLELLRRIVLCDDGEAKKPSMNRFQLNKRQRKKGHGYLDNYHSFRSVTELKAKGIQVRPSSTTSLLDIKFESCCLYGVLKLPPRIVDSQYKTFALNMIAYEMCPSNLNDLAFTSYISFMSSLIDHPDDVKELRLKNIILNNLGSDQEVAKLFKEISTHSVVNFEIYRDIKERVQEHYNSIIRTWISEIIHIYFSSPWVFIAFLAGASVIFLTFVETYFTIFPPTDKCLVSICAHLNKDV